MPIYYKEYPSNWKTEIRPAVLRRANNRCEECCVPNHSYIVRDRTGKWRYRFSLKYLNELKECGFKSKYITEEYDCTYIILTIAHLDHDKLNHDVKLERLKALCQRCHLLYDGKHHQQNRKYGRKHKQNNYQLPFDNQNP